MGQMWPAGRTFHTPASNRIMHHVTCSNHLKLANQTSAVTRYKLKPLERWSHIMHVQIFEEPPSILNLCHKKGLTRCN